MKIPAFSMCKQCSLVTFATMIFSSNLDSATILETFSIPIVRIIQRNLEASLALWLCHWPRVAGSIPCFFILLDETIS